MKQGFVYYDDSFCGTITQTDENIFIFEYGERWFNDKNSKLVSLTLPKTNKRYESNVLFYYPCK